MIQKNSLSISNIVVSSAFGWGDGVPILKFFRPSYNELLKIALLTKTTTITKSMTHKPRNGNFNIWNPISWLQNIKLTKGGLYNSFGLTNEGSGKVSDVLKQLRDESYKILPSIYAENEHDLTFCMYDFLPKKSLELNVACPSSSFVFSKELLKRMIDSVRIDYQGIVIILKVGVETPIELIEVFEEYGGDILHSINTVPTMYKGKRMGKSGKFIFQDALQHNKKLRKITNLPMIMGGGVSSIDNAQAFFDIGANSVSLCTLALLNPNAAKEIILHFNG
jgi:dihydroorotate dehydrogenase